MPFGKRFQHQLVQTGRLTRFLQGAVSGVALIRAHAEETPISQRFDQHNEAVHHSGWQVAKVRALLFPLMGAVTSIGAMFALLFGGRAVVQAELSLAEFVAFAGYLHLLAAPTISLGWVIAIVARGRAAWGRLNELLTLEAAIQEAPDAQTPERRDGAVSVRGLTFTYEGAEAPVLRDIDLNLSAGGMLGIVGRVASGKTTRVCSRASRTPSRDRPVDQQPVERWPLADLRQHIAVVPQDIFLLTDRLDRNLALGRLEATEEEIIEAAKTAELHDDIVTFSDGYATEVGERGVTLSGGQRQRAAIARALLHPGRILILDDCLRRR